MIYSVVLILSRSLVVLAIWLLSSHRKTAIKKPIVLHGASGTPKFILDKAKKFGMDIKGIHGLDEPELRRAVQAGINKVNNDTDIRIAFSGEVREQLKNKKIFDVRKYLGPARDFAQQLVEHRIKVMGSQNKAKHY